MTTEKTRSSLKSMSRRSFMQLLSSILLFPIAGWLLAKSSDVNEALVEHEGWILKARDIGKDPE